MKSIEREEIFDAEPEEVWAVLTHPDSLSEWFGARVVELELRRGGRIAFRDRDGWERRGVVQTVDEARAFAFRWLPFGLSAGRGVYPLPGTTVELTLEAAENGTRMRVVEWGFDADDPELAGLSPLGEAHA